MNLTNNSSRTSGRNRTELKRLRPIADKLEFAQQEARILLKQSNTENTTSRIMIDLIVCDKLGMNGKGGTIRRIT